MSASLARRYIFKLLANIVSVPVYLLMEAILPHALGPVNYGNFNFATNFFQQFAGFLDMGTSTCFYNSLARKQNDITLFSFYLRIIFLAGIIIAIVSLVLFLPLPGSLLMPGIPAWIIPLAAAWAFLVWGGRVLRSANDAIGSTVASEVWRTCISLFCTVILLVFFISGALNLQTLFLQQYLLFGLSFFAYWHVTASYWRKNGEIISYHINKSAKKILLKEFFSYSHPLFVQSLLSFGMIITERWLLQWFDGSTQQGFYALSQKVSAACFLFVSAMTPLLMREFSIAWGKKDLKGMGSLLTRFAPLLYALAAYFSCFTVVEGKALVEIFGGSEFASAILPVQIMALYPLHQAYGQMAGSVFYASGKTRIPRNLTALECIYGLLFSWFLIAPAKLGGMNLGATGLAIKTVAVQFISVNIYLWLAGKLIPFNFWRNLCHQFVCVIAMLCIAFLAKNCSFAIDYFKDIFWLRFFFSGILYTVFVCVAFAVFPWLAGMSKQQVYDFYKRFKLYLIKQ